MGIEQTFPGAVLPTDEPKAVAPTRESRALNQSTRKNHFVPCFYSSLWSGEDGKLCEFTRPFDCVKPRRKHPAATGYSIDLYTESALPSALRTYLEDVFLKRVDQKAFDALQLLLAGRIDDLTEELQSAWARFIMSMVQRSPGRMATLRNLWRGEYLKHDDSIERRYRELRKETDPPSFKQYLDQAPPEIAGRGFVRMLQNVIDLRTAGLHIVNMRWSVLVVPDVQFTLLTSDRPVVMTNGIQRPEGHIVIPIGPRKLFLAATQQQTIDGLTAVPSSDLILEVNKKIVKQAEKFVYGESDLHRNFVEKYLRRSRDDGSTAL